jgi:NAD(P)-dependent dehydrogenase (short-subunit alcohol dehydrogenase family)
MAIQRNSPKSSPFFLVSEAGSDRGYALARSLLAAGNRVVAIDRNAASLVRIGHGYRSDQLLLVAADVTQAEQAIARAYAHFGEVAPSLALCAAYRRSSAA